MTRAVINFAFGERYLRGQVRLRKALREHSPESLNYFSCAGWPLGCPPHEARPYAFKSYMLFYARNTLAYVRNNGSGLVLWLDAAVKPVRSLEPLWERIEHDGYWFAQNAWNNYQWTADSAYPALFPQLGLILARELNKSIPQVMACAFGLSLRSSIGAEFLDEYYRLASETDAFCGPWWNSNNPANRGKDPLKTGPCGAPDVIGHRHDQTAASVIAWRLGMHLTPGHRDPEGDILAYPEWFPNRKVPERVLLVHDGSMD